VALDEVLRKYRTLLNNVYDGCMAENGFKLRIGWEWCTAFEVTSGAFGRYEPTR
jgi:hypothetical protein